MFPVFLFFYLTVSYVNTHNCTGAEKGCAVLYVRLECIHPVYNLKDGDSIPELINDISSVLVTKLCTLELFSDINYEGNEQKYSGNRLSAQYYPVKTAEIVSARCNCHEDPGPDDNCGFLVLVIIILSIIVIVFGVAICVFCMRTPSAPRDALPSLSGDNHVYETGEP